MIPLLSIGSPLAWIIDHDDPPPGHPLYALAIERRAALRELHLLEGFVRGLGDRRLRGRS